eukprot:CAMPEP_0115594252 /NCGR_PEP_ID=MMETSP0272-20121206/11713_1 /TAXON_ID=71861 /ORGANISM="Scrippsiella trochoidea, Strain CCMP3099" /LENGTH=103 /DNA_ID=CAMNT_0003029531 /DNA_START=185 /DNA_END=497 /DNA_ORIENTATION=-
MTATRRPLCGETGATSLIAVPQSPGWAQFAKASEPCEDVGAEDMLKYCSVPGGNLGSPSAGGWVQSHLLPIRQQKPYDSGLHWPLATTPLVQSHTFPTAQQKA